MNIHIISNSLRMNSGFSNVARYLADGLRNIGHDVSMTGLQTAYLPEYSYGIECLPVDTVFVDETTQVMLNIQKTNPDIVFCIHQADADMNHLFKLFHRTALYAPVEGQNIHDGMANDLRSIEKDGGVVIAQCFYGQNEMKKVGINAKCIYHGFNEKIFFPLKDKDIKYCYYSTDVGKVSTDPLILHRQGCYDCKNIKKDCPYFKEEIIAILRYDDNNKRWTQKDIEINKLKEEFKGRFIYLFVGQNFGLRKRIERLLKAYSILISESRQIKDGSVLHLHTMPISIKGINLIKIIQDLGISKNVMFSYGSFRSSSWSEQALSTLYNLSDVNVSASSSEGFCLIPDSPILTSDRGVQKIKDINVEDRVLTHKGRFMKVSKVMNRQYDGNMIKIMPHKLRIPICLTPEHRVLGVKTRTCIGHRNKSGNIICRQGIDCYYNARGRNYKYCDYVNGEEPWRKYKIEWIDAKDLDIGDFVIYPRANEKEFDIEKIRISEYIDDSLNIIGDIKYDGSIQIDLFGDYVKDTITMDNAYSHSHGKIYSEFELTKDVMRLFGYFIAEGYVSIDNSRIQFAFHVKENEFIEDVERIMSKTFGLDCSHIIKDNSHILDYSNSILGNLFQNMFCPKEYETKKGKGRKANIVRIPTEFLNLPIYKLAELIKGIWRGDGSDSSLEYNISTTSETLVHQLLYILSKFNVLASIRSDSVKGDKSSLEYRIMVYGKDINLIDKIVGYRNLSRDNVHEGKSKYLKGRNYFYIQIANIDIINYNGCVYNLEVEEDNSYVCPISVHNCLPVLEGMATGLPMIAPDCSSFTELIGKEDKKPRGLLAKIGEWQMIQDQSIRALVEEKDLANQMKIMYTKKDDRKIYSKNAIEWSKNHTWDKKVKEFDDLFKMMI